MRIHSKARSDIWQRESYGKASEHDEDNRKVGLLVGVAIVLTYRTCHAHLHPT